MLSIRLYRAPEALPADAPAEEFSAARAMLHVEQLARGTRALGTPGHADARDYLIDELASLGMEVRVEADLAARLDQDMLASAPVENVVGHLRGQRGEGEALLLVAHYDSHPHTRGAADDASGVAVLLETLRALRSGPPLANDLHVLITDGEELGLLGAEAAVRAGWMQESVGLAFNVEARGCRGPSLMFETGPQNGRLIREMASVVPRPRATSLTGAVYERMPNDTDFTLLREAGIPGYNLAFIGGIEAYHNALDTPERLDPASVQHHGSTLLALTRRFGALDLEDLHAADALYFNLLGDRLVVYPARWGLPLALLAVGLFALLLVRARRRQIFSRSGVLRGLALYLLTLLAAAATGAASWWLAQLCFPPVAWGPYGLPYDAGLWALGLCALILGSAAGLLRRAAHVCTLPDLMAGVLLLWSVLALVAAFLLPGASYLFVWPLLGATGALLHARTGAGLRSPGALLSWTLVALLATLLFAPLVPLLFDALTVRMAGVLALPIAFALGLFAPLLVQMGARPILPVLLGAGGLVLLVVLGARTGFDAEHPRSDSLLYLLDADTQEARWISFDERPDAWTQNALGDEPSRSPLPDFFSRKVRKALQRETQAVQLATPSITIERTEESPDGRILELRLRSARGAATLLASIEDPSALLALSIDDLPVSLEDLDRDERAWLLLHGVGDEGRHLGMTLEGEASLVIDLCDQTYGFSGLPDAPPAERPADLIPNGAWWNDSVLVHTRFTWPQEDQD